MCQVPCDFVACVSEEILLSSTAPSQWCNFNAFLKSRLVWAGCSNLCPGLAERVNISWDHSCKNCSVPYFFSSWLGLHLWWIRDFPQDTKVLRLPVPWSSFHFGSSFSEGALKSTCTGTEVFSWLYLHPCALSKPVLNVPLPWILLFSSWVQ